MASEGAPIVAALERAYQTLVSPACACKVCARLDDDVRGWLDAKLLLAKRGAGRGTVGVARLLVILETVADVRDLTISMLSEHRRRCLTDGCSHYPGRTPGDRPGDMHGDT